MTQPIRNRIPRSTIFGILLISACATNPNKELPNTSLCPAIPYDPGENPPPLETDFSYGAAESSAQKLKGIVSGKQDYEWFTINNLAVYIEGYALRRDAFNATGESRANSRSTFCDFMKNRAIFMD